MKLERIRLHWVDMPLVSPFRTSFGVEATRTALMVEADLTGQRGPVTGWGECVAMADPLYSAEYRDGAADVIRRWLAPALFAAGQITAETVGPLLRAVVGHPMAKAAVEMAVLDGQLRDRDQSFADYLGVSRGQVPSGVSVGIQESTDQLISTVGGYLEQGYARIKLKIEPGCDVDPVAAVRSEFGSDLPLQVDANAAYTLADARQLRKLDRFDLLLIEQPLGESDLRQHAELARLLDTPICLDESITSAEDAAAAISWGAAAVINIKPGRVGGYLEARRIHDLARAFGVPVWCGGMLETGIGRAANIALAGLPGFTLTGDISGSDRFYAEDLTEPVVMRDGAVEVPRRPGFGREIDPDRLRRFRTEQAELTPP